MSHSGYTPLPSSSSASDYHQQRTQQLVEQTYDTLQRTSGSIQRSIAYATETEQTGTEVLNELGSQGESLRRTADRLQDADAELSKSRAIIRKLGREVLYNKIILILIIILEVGVLVGLITLKVLK